VAESFADAKGKVVFDDLVAMMVENRAYLSEVDGAIGDGDHGINMSKGFKMAAERVAEDAGFVDSIKTLGKTLVMEIGGSMGPLYGAFFKAMAKAGSGKDEIDAATFAGMIDDAYQQIQALGNAQVGDKTLIDALDPGVKALKAALDSGKSFSEALDDMVAAAEKGKDSTKDMVAKVGRSARLGERSRGVLDAGATSCFLILQSMAGSIKKLL
jgi:phosphoenolpyruvate---glycerone phosphotransferase subunit DhaL